MKSFFTLLFIVFVFASTAQKSLYEYAIQEDEEFFKDTFIGSDITDDFSRAYSKGKITNDDIPLKKIGLLSFFLFEINYKKEKAHLVYKHKYEGNTIIQTIYNSSIGPLKDSLKRKGIQLLTPSEFLTTEGQKDAYEDAASRIQLIVNKKIGVQNVLNKYNSINTPSGIKYISSNIEEGKNQEILNIIAELSEALRLDGMMTIQLVSEYFNYAMTFKSLSLEIYGPHPLPDRKKGILGYKLGNYAYICLDSRGFAGIKKDNVIREDYRAFPYLVARSGADFINFLQLELNTLFEL